MEGVGIHSAWVEAVCPPAGRLRRRKGDLSSVQAINNPISDAKDVIAINARSDASASSESSGALNAASHKLTADTIVERSLRYSGGAQLRTAPDATHPSSMCNLAL